MNVSTIVGNLVRDPELKSLPSGKAVCNFTVAVNRSYKNDQGEYPADYINCVTYGNTAEFVHKYFLKGSPIGIVGELQTRKYTTKNGDERHIMEVIVSKAEFVGKREKKTDDIFDGMTPIDDSELPF